MPKIQLKKSNTCYTRALCSLSLLDILHAKQLEPNEHITYFCGKSESKAASPRVRWLSLIRSRRSRRIWYCLWDCAKAQYTLAIISWSRINLTAKSEVPSDIPLWFLSCAADEPQSLNSFIPCIGSSILIEPSSRSVISRSRLLCLVYCCMISSHDLHSRNMIWTIDCL
jgi:hypothetical protein